MSFDDGPYVERNNALRAYMDARERKEKADREKKAADANLKEHLNTCYTLLKAGGTKGTVTTDLGPGYGTISFRTGETVIADVYDEPAFKEWVRVEGREQELFQTDKIRKAPINEFVREIREHEDAKFPPGVQPLETKKITATRKK